MDTHQDPPLDGAELSEDMAVETETVVEEEETQTQSLTGRSMLFRCGVCHRFNLLNKVVVCHCCRMLSDLSYEVLRAGSH